MRITGRHPPLAARRHLKNHHRRQLIVITYAGSGGHRCLRPKGVHDDVESVITFAGIRAVLSTYLGHVHWSDTYWYLSALPELMREAMSRLEQRWEQRS